MLRTVGVERGGWMNPFRILLGRCKMESSSRPGVTQAAPGGYLIPIKRNAAVVAVMMWCLLCGSLHASRVTPWIFEVERPPASSSLFVTVKQTGLNKAPTALRVFRVETTRRSSLALFTVTEGIHELTGTRVSPDGRQIAVIGPGIRVYNLEGHLVGEFTGPRPSPIVRWGPKLGKLAISVSTSSPHRKDLELWSPGEVAAPKILARDLRSSDPLEWSPAGDQIIFLAQTPGKARDNSATLVIQDVRSGERRALASGVRSPIQVAWRPDSRTIVWTQRRDDRLETEIWVGDVNGTKSRLGPWIPGIARGVHWSPDGQFLAFTWTSPHYGRDQRGETAPCFLPAAAVLGSEARVSAQNAMVCLWKARVSGGGWYGWSASSAASILI